MKSSQYSKLNKINNFYIQVNMAFSVTVCIHVSPTQSCHIFTPHWNPIQLSHGTYKQVPFLEETGHHCPQFSFINGLTMNWTASMHAV